MSNENNPSRLNSTAAEYYEAITAALSVNGLGEYADNGKTELYAEYLAYLAEENSKFNLTAIVKPDDAALLHIADSLTVAPLPEKGCRMLDIGSGAGLPAVPVAIARPDIHVFALDSTAKKTEFINNATKKLGINNLTTYCGRAEDLAQEQKAVLQRGTFGFVTARGVAPLNILCELAAPFLERGGIFAAMKGSRANEEAEEARSAAAILGLTLKRTVNITLKQPDNGTENVRTILLYEKTAETPGIYPRPYTRIKKKPL